MSTPVPQDPANDRTAPLALGFAITVAMWAVAYLCRLPVVLAPSWLLLVLLLACLVAGGWVAGWSAGRVRVGVLAGLLAGLLNLLVLGSLVAGPQPNRVVPSALWWLPGSLLAGALFAGAGALAGRAARGARHRPIRWTPVLSRVAAVATFLLLVAGGLVTGHEAGLAVADWPNSFGYAMFLYPLSRMTGGIYYEHAHRLFGSLVGLTTMVLALHLWRVERRRWVVRVAGLAVLLVVGQGILGGLRVTGHFTMATARAAMTPSLTLAVVHGVTGQLFFAVMVLLAVITSGAWRDAPPAREATGAGADRTLQVLLLTALAVQLVLGALQRHEAEALLVHITMAVVVTVLALLAGARAWGLHGDALALSVWGRAVVGLVGLQVLLGISALIATGGKVTATPSTLQATVTTAHQACGALLLGASVTLAAWTRRLLASPPRPEYVRE